MTEATPRSMSLGYGLSFGFGVVTVPFLGVALGGLLLLRTRRNPLDAIDGSGFACFAGAFALTFFMRLIFWNRSTEAVRSTVRRVLTAVFSSFPPVTIATVGVAITQSRVPPWLLAFVALAAIGQVPTLVWLLRYRTQA